MRSTVSTSSLLATIMVGMFSPASLSPSLNPLGPLVSDWKNPTAACSQDNAGNKLKERQMFLSCMEAGKHAVAKDDLHAALKHFSEACEINPAIAESHNNLGNVLIELGEVERAIECYGRALEVNPKLFNAHFNLATVWHAKATKIRTAEGRWGPISIDHWKKARRCYLQALQCSPDNQDCQYNLANLYSERGFSRQALELYGKSAFADDSIDSQSLVNMGVAAFNAGHLQAAEQCFRRAIYNDPKCEQATMNLALCIVGKGLQKWHVGQAKEATVAFHECAALVPVPSKGSHAVPRYLAWSCACAVAISWSEQATSNSTSTDWILDRAFLALGMDRESGAENGRETLDAALLLFLCGMKEESKAILRRSNGVDRDRQGQELAIAALSFWGKFGRLIEQCDKAELLRALTFCGKDDILHPTVLLTGNMDYQSLVTSLDSLRDSQAAPNSVIRGWLLQKADPFARPLMRFLKSLEPSKVGRELLGATEYIVKGTIFGDRPPHPNLKRACRVIFFVLVLEGQGWFIFDEGFVLKDEAVKVCQNLNQDHEEKPVGGDVTLQRGEGPVTEGEESEEERELKNMEAAEGNIEDEIDLASNSLKDSWCSVWDQMEEQVKEMRASMEMYQSELGDPEAAARRDVPLQLLQFQFEVARLEAPLDKTSSSPRLPLDVNQEKMQVKLHDVISGVDWQSFFHALPLEHRDVADSLVYDAIMMLIMGNEYSSTHFIRMDTSNT